MSPRRNNHSRPRKTADSQPSFVRIIGGDWRSRKLAFPDSAGLRPTPDRVRETLFNWLQAYTAGAYCLDLFSGSGALAFETLSRGAAHATLIDASNQVCRSLKQNLLNLKTQKAEVLEVDALQWLASQKDGTGTRYDVIFLDPPFNQGLIEPICALLETNALLAADAMIYIESETSLGTPKVPNHWMLYREKRAGQVDYRLYKRQT